MKRCLTIAGSDSGGGAGIQADLKTFAALGAYGTSVVTAITAQNTQGVLGIEDVSPELVRLQIIAILDDIGTDAIKIGMLHSGELISVVAAGLAQVQAPIVLDPVMVAKGGAPLLKPEALAALRERLIPRAAVLTPNLPEAELLLGRSIANESEMRDAAIALLALGPKAVLLKGGHLAGPESRDCLAETGARVTWLSNPRIPTRNTHGTGCTLSSAIAVGLARGESVAATARAAKDYVHGAIRAGATLNLGSGHGPLHHFWNRE